MTRNYGIDLFRVGAIAMVVGANAIYLFQSSALALQLAPLFGHFGLESFLVLAGFLMGVSLYRNWANADAPGFLTRFTFGRTARILPLYIVVLALNAILSASMDAPVPPLVQYVLLFQNFASPIPPFFPESWGIPVIVWSTVALIALIAAWGKVFPSRKKVILPLTLLGLTAVCWWTRWLFTTQHPALDLTVWDTALKTVVIFRMDAVFTGALFGWGMTAFPECTARFRIPVAAAALGLVGFLSVGVGFWGLTIDRVPLFWTMLYLPTSSLAVGGLLPLFFGWVGGPMQRFIRLLSDSAYAIFLVHFSLVLLPIESWFADAEIPFYLPILYLIGAFGVGILSHLLIEKPLTRVLARNLERF